MKKVMWKTILSGGVLAAALMLSTTQAHASSLYNTLQELYNGTSSTTTSLTGGSGSSGSSSNSGFGSTASSGYGNISYAINQPTIQQQQQQQKKDVSGNDVSGNSTTAATVQNLLMDTAPIGPTVADAAMSELYHENYGVYEERLTEGYSIYTNVSNGSITDRPVIFDVPSGVTVSMTRDGNRADFNNRSAMEREGYYVLLFYIVDDETRDEPFSKQNISRGKFRFRIQYDEGINGYAAAELTDRQQEATPEDFSSFIEGELEESEGQEQSEPEAPALEMPEVTPAEEQVMEQTEEAKPLLTPVAYSNGIETTYDAASGYYNNTLRTGSGFLTNFKNGTVTNDPVIVKASDTITYEVYRGGQPMEEFIPDEYLTEAGSYEIYPVEDSSAYAQAYPSEKPVLRFRIVDTAAPVSDLGVLNAPEGTVYTDVRLDGETADASIFRNEKTLNLEKDGTYLVSMTSEAGESDLVVMVDKTAPRFSVATKPNLASIAYQSSDVSRVMVYRGNDLVNNGNVVSTITEPGRYSMTVFDRAGNSTTQSFVINYRINAGAVIAILIVIGLMVALGVFIYKVRSSVKVV